ncbi:MAG: hypothetical protein FJ026_17830 [Chloroflexi bacterium]|nr:hypothetical protein [Chloroflexota bacterium]
MPRVICWQMDCLYNVDGRCRAEEIEYDPADGCLTTEPRPGLDDLDEDEEEGWQRSGMHLLDDEQ